MIKRLEKDKQYKIIEVSNIKSNQKNPKYCHVCIQYQRIVKYKEYGGSELCAK